MPISNGISLGFPEEQLKAWLFAIFSNSSDGIAFIDSDYNILYANELFSQQLGVPLQEMMSSPREQVIPGLSRQPAHMYEEARRTGEPLKGEAIPFQFVKQPERGITYWNYTIAPVNGKYGTFLGWVLMHREVTQSVTLEIERKELTAKLKQERNELETVIDSMEEGIIITDLHRNVSKLNNVASQMIGHDISQAGSNDLFQNPSDFELFDLNGNPIPFAKRPFNRVKDGETFNNYELELRHISTGDNRYVSFNGTLVKTSDGTPMLAVEIIRDISLREKLLRQLEQEQTRTQAVFDQMPCGVLIVEAPSGNLISANKRHAEIFRFPIVSEMSKRQKTFKLFYSDGQPYPEENWPLVRSLHLGETVSDEENIIERGDGTFGVVLTNSAPVLDRDGNIVAGVVVTTDITELKEVMTRAALANQLQQIIEFLPDGTFVVDQGQKVIAWNRAIELLTSVPKQEIIGTGAYAKAVYGIDQLTLIDVILNDKPGNMKSSFEKTEDIYSRQISLPRLHQKDNVYLEIKATPLRNDHGETIGVIETIRDITEHKQFEAVIASERELLMVTLNSLGEGVVATDQDERIMLINQAAADLTGYSQNEAIGEPLSKFLYVLDDKTSEPLDKISSQSAFCHPILVTRDLREVAVSINSSPIKATDGQIIGAVTVFQDISEKQKIEQNLLKAEKIESLGVLAGGIAHDFNNILAAILANLQLAAIKLKKCQDISKYLDDTIETTRRASDLTKQLLTFSKGGTPIKKAASIKDLVKNTVLFALSGSKVKAEFHLPEDLWVVDIDEGQITQVINNLTINAEQSMPIGGTLHIDGENVIIETTGQYQPGQYVKLTIKDQGIGIPEEIILKIFDPFFTTKSVGTGLGLSTSYSIIKKHNGYIEVESVPGVGTTFYIYLPTSNEVLAITESQRQVAACGDAKILLMDDDYTIRTVGGDLLACFGYRVTLACDGQETIELYSQAQKSGDPFDAVIMDLTVPGSLGGLETLTILRRIEPRIRAIVSSGYANDPVMSDYERYGFSGMVTKPYKFDELNAVLCKVIEKKQLPLDLTY